MSIYSTISTTPTTTTAVSSTIIIYSGIGGLGITNDTDAFTAGVVVFSGSNLTIGTSVDAGTQYIQIEAPTLGGIAIGDGASNVTDSTIIFGDLNGISFGLNGSTMTASHNAYSNTTQFSSAFLTTAMQSVCTSVFQYTSNTSAITADAVNTATLVNLQYTSATSLITSNAFPSSATTKLVGNIIAVSGSTAASTGTVAFIDSNGIDFGLSSTQITANITGLNSNISVLDHNLIIKDNHLTLEVGNTQNAGAQLYLSEPLDSTTYYHELNLYAHTYLKNTLTRSNKFGSIKVDNEPNIYLFAYKYSYLTTDPGTTDSISSIAAVVLNADNGLHYSTLVSFTGVTNLSTSWSTNENWIPHRKWIDDQIDNISTNSYLTTAAQTDHTHGSISIASTDGTEFTYSSASNGMSFSIPNWITTYAGGGGIGASIGGNSTSAGAGYSNITSGTVILAGGNNITLSQDGVNITISGANAGGAQTGISGIGVSNTTYTSGTVIWSGQNNVTLGSSTDGVSQYVRISVGNYLTTAMASNASTNFAGIGESTGSITGSDLKLTVNTDGVSMDIPKWITTYAQSEEPRVVSLNGSSGSISLNVGSSLSASSDASSITIGLASNITTALQSAGAYLTGYTETQTFVSGIGNGNTLYTSGTVIIQGQNNITVNSSLGTGASSNSQYLNISAPNAILELQASNGTVFGGTAFFSGYSNLTVSQTINTYRFSVADAIPLGNSTAYNSSVLSATFQTTGNYLTTAMASESTSVFQYTSNTSAITSNAFPSADTTKFAGTGTTAVNATFTLNSNGLNLSVAAPEAAAEANWFNLQGNTASNTTASGSTIMLSAGNNITLAATNGSVIQIVGAAGAGSIYSGDFISLSVVGGSTSISVTNTSSFTSLAMNTSERANYFYTSNNTFLTTAAASDHTHDYASSNHTHSDLYINTSVSGSFQLTSDNSLSLGTGYTTHTHEYQSTGNYLTTAALSSQTLAFTIGGNSGTTNSSQILNSGYILAGGANITINQSNNTISIVGGAGGGGPAVAAAGATVTNGTAVFSNSNGVSFGGNGSTITAQIAGVGTVNFSDGSGISWGSSVDGVSSTITGSIQQAYYLSGANTAGTTSFSAGSAVTFSGGNNITLSGNSNNQIVISAGASGAGGVALSASNSLYSSGTAVLSGSSNITVSYNASTILLSVADAIPLANSTAYATSILDNTFQLLANSTLSAGIGTTTGTTSGTALAVTLNTAGINITYPNVGYLSLVNSNGYTWSTSVNGVSTAIWLVLGHTA